MADYSAFTNQVIDSIGKDASPRVKATFPILIRKIHEAMIEADITVEEWMETCELLVAAGKVSNPMRNEVVLITDVLGIESLVDMLQHERRAKANAAGTTTPSAILGPFYLDGLVPQPMGTSVIGRAEPGADFTHLFGVVRGKDGRPIEGAMFDVWHDAPDGLYDSQSPEKLIHCRGRFITGADGQFSLICLKPTPYPIPYDHQAGHLLKLLGRHPYRPAHLHFLVAAKGYKTLVTQVFDRTSKYLDDDSVFAVKPSLVVDFKPLTSASKALPKGGPFDDTVKFELEYDIALVPESE